MHINVLEFLVVLVQLADCIVAVELGHTRTICGETLPEIPHLLAWTDNTASESWANKVTTGSRRASSPISFKEALLDSRPTMLQAFQTTDRISHRDPTVQLNCHSHTFTALNRL
jgi:hypothetical protein